MPHSIVYEKKYYHFLEPLGAPRAHVEPWCFVLLAGHALPTSHCTHPAAPLPSSSPGDQEVEEAREAEDAQIRRRLLAAGR